jgi:hypothetical protein
VALFECITVDARITLEELVQRLEAEDDRMYVAVRRFESGETYWYVFQVGDIRALARRVDDELRVSNLTRALDLHEYQRVEEHQSSENLDYRSSSGILLWGDEAIGVLRPKSVTRSIDAPDLGDVMTTDGGAEAAAGREADRKPFSAFTALTTPAAVTSRQEFDLEVGLSAKPVPGVSGGPISIANAPERFSFDLQVVADGFTFSGSSKAKLEVNRDAFQSARAVVRLIAPEVTDPSGFRGTIEVLFFYNGNICGRAERQVTVGGTALPEAPSTEESRSSVSIPDQPAPDLTVTISEGASDTTLVWVFRSPHEIDAIPELPVSKTFSNQTAKQFALDKVRRMAEWDKNPLTTAQLTGIGEEISATMPNEFWLVLDAVWAEKRRQNVDKPPSVLFVSKDPYVPWELAAVTSNYARADKIDAAKPPFLGAHVFIGKWIPPVSTPFGGDIPTLPPVPTTDVEAMVLFIGDYAAAQGQRPLPLAIEEGQKLALRYAAIQRSADLNDVTDLVNDQIDEDGMAVRVDAIHFACHGEISADPRYNGIVLDDSGIRLGADMISGSSIGKSSNPFVFLNACQLGTETVGLDGNYGGMAGAFLSQGATGFISPLWSVDDDIAQEFAVEFYQRVFEEDRPVAEVMSELRSKFSKDSSKPALSYLAYVYYGHPGLVINKI